MLCILCQYFASVDQLAVDAKGNLLVSCGELTVYKFSAQTLSWEAFACPFVASVAATIRFGGCAVSNESDVHATFAWLLDDNRLIVCNIGYKYLDKVYEKNMMPPSYLSSEKTR